jgi:hypothetical protein
VFLQVVAFTADVRNHLKAVGQAHFGNFPQSRVGLLWRGGVNAGANTTALGRIFHRRALGLDGLNRTPLTD